MAGRTCGVKGIRPDAYCEPKTASIGSRDTTGSMTRDELRDLAYLGFSAGLVMQSFYRTATCPKPADVNTRHTLPDFIIDRDSVSLCPGDSVTHSWLNRMLLPDTVGTGGDSHTRPPTGTSLPASSGLVVSTAAIGITPLDMPGSVPVHLKGRMQPGITLCDLVHAISLYAIKQGLLTVEREGKKNTFSGRVLEIEGLPDLKVEQVLELTGASAECSAVSCIIKLNKGPIIEYLNSNIVLLKWMIAEGYGDHRTLECRIQGMKEWLANPELLETNADIEYAAVIDIDLADIREPILCTPSDPDDACPLSAIQGEKIGKMFIGSCTTSIGHFRAAGKLLDAHKGQLPTCLWAAPLTRMDVTRSTEEGYYSIFSRSGACIETSGYSLCMGNQARITDGATVISTSIHSLPSRLGTGANVFLASAELVAVAALISKLPTPKEYQTYAAQIDKTAVGTHRYPNFNQLSQYIEKADGVIFQAVV